MGIFNSLIGEEYAHRCFFRLKQYTDHFLKPSVYKAHIFLSLDQYISFYNNVRIQLKTKLTPLQKRSQYVA